MNAGGAIGCLPILNGSFLPVGTTDSELAFCYLLQQMRARFGDTLPAMFALADFMHEITAEIAAFGTFNMMLSNGEALFVHCSTKLHYIVRQYPFPVANLSDEQVTVDFSKVTTPNDKVAVIVTEPLTNNETWTQFAPGQMAVFVDGDVVAFASTGETL